MSYLTFGQMPSWLPHISKMGPLFLPLVTLFPFNISYPPHLSSIFLLKSLDVLIFSKITPLPSPNLPLMLSKVYLLAILRHRRALKCTFLTPAIMWLLLMHLPWGLSLILSLAFSKSHCYISSTWLPSHGGHCRSPPFGSLSSTLSLLLLLFPQFYMSPLLWIQIHCPPPLWPLHMSLVHSSKEKVWCSPFNLSHLHVHPWFFYGKLNVGTFTLMIFHLKVVVAKNLSSLCAQLWFFVQKETWHQILDPMYSCFHSFEWTTIH